VIELGEPSGFLAKVRGFALTPAELDGDLSFQLVVEVERDLAERPRAKRLPTFVPAVAKRFRQR
jgi:hypothetical protein